jgi:hypothetical protein
LRHFLYLTNTRLVSIVTTGKRIAARREFAVTGAGVAEFERHAGGMAGAPTRVFTDLSEEDFRLDTIPHVGASDRDALLTRKLSQIFRNTPYRHALLQGREAEGRRDDRVMYTAITNPELLRPWLEVLDRLQVPLEGIHSSAVFSSVLLDELDLQFPHTLLVTFTPGNAMRQTYFRDGEIKFSRLTPIDLEQGQTLGSMISEETTRTWQYLDSLRNFSEADRLEVCVLVHPNDRAAVQPALRDFSQIQYRILDMEQVSANLGLKPPPLDSTAEEVVVHLSLMRRPENHFASPELRRHAMLGNARGILLKLSIAVLGAGLIWATWNLSRVLKETEADQKITQQITALNRERDEIARALPTFGVGGSTMRDAVTFYNSAMSGFPAILDLLVPLSQVLRSHPDIRLTQVAWQATDDLKEGPKLQATPPRNAPPVKAIAKSGEAQRQQRPGEDGANPPFAGGRYEIALVEATVRVGPNDFRGALSEAERFASDIAKAAGFQADVIESPLDVRPAVILQGRHPEKDAAFMEPRFVVKIVREKRSPA